MKKEVANLKKNEQLMTLSRKLIIRIKCLFKIWIKHLSAHFCMCTMQYVLLFVIYISVMPKNNIQLFIVFQGRYAR